MERRTCKLCFKSFSNGRALGGHMRSHMATLQPPPRPPPQPTTTTTVTAANSALENQQIQQQQQAGVHPRINESASSSSASSSSSSEEEEKGLLSYGLRENPKKSFRLVDPEFSFTVDAGSVVQDRESETESSKNPSRRRSKRTRNKSAASPSTMLLQRHKNQNKKPKSSKAGNNADSTIDPEPVSSVSDTTPEEDVARCLMLLSRGVWATKQEIVEYQGDDDDEEEEEERERSIEETDDDNDDDDDDDDDLEEFKFSLNRSRGKYQCGTCKKVFRSYQALGGHRASHKKIKGCNSGSFSSTAVIAAGRTITITTTTTTTTTATAHEEAVNEKRGNVALVASGSNNNSAVAEDRRVHECPVCFRVFGSGQALGGHKRSHLSASSAAPTIVNVNRNATKTANSTKFADNLIDLNLPAPIDDDDYSQIELSAVSDAEFVDPIK